MQFLQTNWGTIMTVLFGISEGLSLIPGVKSNGVFMAIYNFLKDATKPSAPSK